MKEYIDPYYSPHYFAEQQRLFEAASMNNEWNLEEIEQKKVDDEQKAFEDGDLLATMPDPESLPRQKHLYIREKARLRSEIIKRKLTGQNWTLKLEQVSGKTYYYNDDSGEASWEEPQILKLLKAQELARKNGWAALPSKALVNVMEFLLPYPERTNCSTTCQHWRAAANDNSFVLHVWPVEMGALVMDESKLGKNHFRTISDAINAARPGDMIELGDGHYWINDPGLMVDIPIKFVGDEEDPSHVVLELSGEISWKAAGGWMEGITVRRPKMISGASPKNDLLRIESGGRLDVYHCVFDNRGSVGNCVSMTGTGSGGHWVKATLQGASRDCSGLFVGQYACAELIDCNICHNSGVGISRAGSSDLILTNSTVNRNGFGLIGDVEKDMALTVAVIGS
eukprot:g5467.t1 g5467   contig2:591837-593116(+)